MTWRNAVTFHLLFKLDNFPSPHLASSTPTPRDTDTDTDTDTTTLRLIPSPALHANSPLSAIPHAATKIRGTVAYYKPAASPYLQRHVGYNVICNPATAWLMGMASRPPQTHAALPPGP